MMPESGPNQVQTGSNFPPQRCPNFSLKVVQIVSKTRFPHPVKGAGKVPKRTMNAGLVPQRFSPLDSIWTCFGRVFPRVDLELGKVLWTRFGPPVGIVSWGALQTLALTWRGKIETSQVQSSGGNPPNWGNPPNGGNPSAGGPRQIEEIHLARETRRIAEIRQMEEIRHVGKIYRVGKNCQISGEKTSNRWWATRPIGDPRETAARFVARKRPNQFPETLFSPFAWTARSAALRGSAQAFCREVAGTVVLHDGCF